MIQIKISYSIQPINVIYSSQRGVIEGDDMTVIYNLINVWIWWLLGVVLLIVEAL